MSEVVLTQPSLIDVSRIGNHLVTGTTKYLSALPHPIEAVEELIAVTAVTCSLLNSLHAAIARFPSITLSPSSSFLLPLCHDILFAFRLLSERVSEARRLKVFEPNDVGLVRVPRAAWCLVCGNEARAAGLRSRLYVEKYRVRVLIEAVCWIGLNRTENRSLNEENELLALKKMLPLVAERLIGIQRDYVPRLRKLAGKETVGEEKSVTEEKKEIIAPVPIQHTPNMEEPSKLEQQSSEKPHLRSSKSSASLASTCSCSSSVTILNSPIIHETWILRCNEPVKTLNKSRTLFGILPLSKSYTYIPASYYVKPVLSSEAETRSLRLECQSTLTPAQHSAAFKKQILNLPDEAQWEIQKLIETREAACSNSQTKRGWEIVGFMVRGRRRVSHPFQQQKKWWRRAGKQSPVEYVLILKGELIDCENRVMPKKHGDAWSPAPAPLATATPLSTPVGNLNQANNQTQPQQQQQQGAGAILRYVENRRVMSLVEAENKLEEIENELFISKSASNIGLKD